MSVIRRLYPCCYAGWRRYDAARTIEAFSARLREKVDLDEFSAELLTVVDRPWTHQGVAVAAATNTPRTAAVRGGQRRNPGPVRRRGTRGAGRAGGGVASHRVV